MSGGHFDYKHYAIERIADDIDLLIRTNDTEDVNEYGDRIGYGFSPETIAEFKVAVNLLRKAFIYAHQIDYLVSADTSEDTFIEYLQAELEKLKCL